VSPDSGAVQTASGPLFIPTTFFGTNTQDWPVRAPTSGGDGTNPPAFQLGIVSTYDCSALSPSVMFTAANTINWANLDLFVTQWVANGVLSGIFAWHSIGAWLAQAGQAATNDPYGRPGGGSYPNDLTQVAYFFQQFIARNKTVWNGFFKAIQVRNEPEANNFAGTTVGEWWGTAQQFVNERAVIYSTVKTADPSMVVLTCGMYNVPTFSTWLAQAAGGSDIAAAYPALVGTMGWQTFDAVASHPYWATANPTYAGRGTHGTLPQGGVNQIRLALVPYNKQGIDIWCTEFGYDSGGSRASPSATVQAWLAQSANQRRIETIRRFMSGIRHGLKCMCDFSYGGNLLCGDQVADTTGYVLGRQQVYSACAGKTMSAAGYYPDGREWMNFTDGTSLVV